MKVSGYRKNLGPCCVGNPVVDQDDRHPFVPVMRALQRSDGVLR